MLFPYLLSPLLVNTPASQRLIDDVLMRPDRLMVCTAVKREVERAARHPTMSIASAPSCAS